MGGYSCDNRERCCSDGGHQQWWCRSGGGRIARLFNLEEDERPRWWLEERIQFWKKDDVSHGCIEKVEK